VIKGSLSQLSNEVIYELNRLDAATDGDLIITSGYRALDSGEHGRGLAVDIVAPAYMNRLMDIYLAAEKCLWTGIGVYPNWKLNGDIIGGLHLDLRKGPPARWMGLGSGKNQQYVGLTVKTLKENGVI
jgi:hypothetical protein